MQSVRAVAKAPSTELILNNALSSIPCRALSEVMLKPQKCRRLLMDSLTVSLGTPHRRTSVRVVLRIILLRVGCVASVMASGVNDVV